MDEHLYDFWWGLSLHGVIYNTQFYRNTGLTLSEGVFYEDQEFSIIPMAYAEVSMHMIRHFMSIESVM